MILNSLIPANDYPVLRNIFPVNLRRELCEKSLRRSGFLLRNRLLGPEIAEFPVKFPVSREFAWRPVRSALRRQPTSLALGDRAANTLRKARQWRAF